MEYIYDKNEAGESTNTPVVQDGIVIQNVDDGNEFVWVPIGEIKNDAVANTTNKTTITLGRYDDFTVAANGTLPTPAQAASKTEYDTPTLINDYYIEISSNFAGGTFGETEYKAAGEYTDSNGVTNTKALDLQEWISTSLDNGGYYIARYEASKNGTKAASKPTTVDSTSENDSSKVTDGMLWNNITQPNAAIAAQAMYPYSSSAKYYSDLINSYAWNTAIIFIEAYSDSDYATQNGYSINTNIAKAGENADKRCNIQDMAGNVEEWSTETSTRSGKPCTGKGGSYYDGYYTTSRRYCSHASSSSYGISFRESLCVK